MTSHTQSHPSVRRPEVLAPAGDFESLRAAVGFGADAVYLGAEEFSMRQTKNGFTLDSLPEAVDFAHRAGVCVFLTANTTVWPENLAALDGFLRRAKEAGVDGLIASDMAVVCAAAKMGLALHISTQAGITNAAACKAYYEMGAVRAVLARELSLSQIATIRADAPKELELEAFAHGSVCLSHASRCFLSQYLTGRDAARGACTQPCRWEYALMEKRRPGAYYPVEEDEQGGYILNARDLCMLPHIAQLAQAGVDSLKIEGRAKSAYYVACVTNAYRVAVDHYLRDPANSAPPEWVQGEMEKVSHRPYHTGFYFGSPAQGQDPQGGYLCAWDVVAVAEQLEGTRLYLTQKNRFYENDQLEVLQPGTQPFSICVRALADDTGQSIGVANHASAKVSFACPVPVAPGAMLRRKRS